MVKWSQTFKEISQKRWENPAWDERDIVTRLFELHVEHILIKVSITLTVSLESHPGSPGIPVSGPP